MVLSRSAFVTADYSLFSLINAYSLGAGFVRFGSIGLSLRPGHFLNTVYLPDACNYSRMPPDVKKINLAFSLVRESSDVLVSSIN